MMFSKDDFRIESANDLLHFLPILAFIALVAPFLIAAYTFGTSTGPTSLCLMTPFLSIRKVSGTPDTP